MTPFRIAVSRRLTALSVILSHLAYRLSGKLQWMLIVPFGGRRKRVVTVAADSDGRRRQRRSKRDVKQFRRLIDEVFDDFKESSQQRRSRRILKSLPPVDPSLCSSFTNRLYEIPSLADSLFAPREAPIERRVKEIHSCRLGNITDDDWSPILAKAWYCVRFESVGLKALRGRTKILMPYAVRAKFVMKVGRGKLDDPCLFLLSPNGVDWAVLNRHGGIDEDKELETLVRMHMSMQMTDEAVWSMVIEKNGLRLLLTTDAVGIRELLMLRDRDIGTRRAAIRHWVIDHDRRLPNGRIIRVKAHLRGKTEFSWRSWNVNIEPSKHDIEHLSVEGLPSTDLMSILEANMDNFKLGPPRDEASLDAH